MIGAKWGDPVLGIDIHLVMVPTPAGPVPTPLPHPFVGVVFDPIGAALGGIIGGGVVLINGSPAGNTGTEVKGLPHFPTPPGVSPAPNDKPDNAGQLLTGSKTVSFGGSSQSRTFSSAISCSFPVDLPSSICMAVPMGAPVLIGGPEAVDWAVAAMSGVKSGIKNMRSKWGSELLHKLTGAEAGSKRSKFICALTGHPVDVMTGELLAEAVDFDLPGLLPIVWERNYRSRETEEGALGAGWFHPFEESLEDRGRLTLRLADGRTRTHDPLGVGESTWQAEERYTLTRTKEGFERRTWNGIRFFLRKVAGASRFVLTEVRDRAGNRIALEYERGYLVRITDTAGRELEVAWNRRRRIASITFQGRALVRYEYDDDGRLDAARDALDHALRYEYQNGVLVKETHKGGLSFHFEWDWLHPEGCCVRTWGDGGIYDRRITYDMHRHVTTVDDGRKGRTHYWGNAHGLVTKMIDPMGAITETAWDEWCRKTSETDALGNKTEWTYDERGNRIGETSPVGARASWTYDSENLLVSFVDEAGGIWRAEHDSVGKVRRIWSPVGVATEYVHDDHGRLVGIDDPMGRCRRFEWSERHDLVSVADGEKHTTRLEHDSFGRLIQKIDPLLRTTRVTRDPLGRPTYAELADGEVLWLKYDAEGNVVEQLDAQNRLVKMRYGGLRRLVEHTDPMGHSVRLEYDVEEDLVAVENQLGERYSFERDRAGRVTTETGFDQRTHRYFYDGTGRTSKVLGPEYAVTEIERDPLGRVVARKHKDSEEWFAYNPRGELVSARANEVEVRFERDEVGRVVCERATSPGGEHSIESRYDLSGLRVERRTELGHLATYDFDNAGDLRSVTAGVRPEWRSPALERLGLPQMIRDDWRVDIQRDALGLETERTLPGGVTASWNRDPFGRPSERRVTTGGGRFGDPRRDLLRTGYAWQSPDQIAALLDLQAGTRTTFDYDPRGHLIRAVLGDGTVQHRASDAVSNLFKTPDHTDRTYGAGGRLERVGSTELRYDGAGNLIEKRLVDGARWTYRWNAAGRLIEVVRPDEKSVRFAYDALGRRVSKEFEGRKTDFVWDGNDLVHERVTSAGGEAAPITTWVFEPGTFSPIAKLEGRKRFGVVADHLGVPTMLLTEAGEVAWKAQLDVFGVAREEVGSTAQPWRFPGQYEDEETGLYYNRFRYYDPTSGRYISEDPSRLLGGLTSYGYIPDPLLGMDPSGLTPTPSNDSGKFGEDALHRLYRRGEKQKIFPFEGTSNRRVDGFWPGDPGIARESKAGRISLSDRIRSEIERDAQLVDEGIQVEWHFFRSPITQKIGPSQRLRDELEGAGIKVFEHPRLKCK